jgi:hypothetical protein
VVGKPDGVVERGTAAETNGQRDRTHGGDDRHRRQFAEVLGDADLGEFGDHHA